MTTTTETAGGRLPIELSATQTLQPGDRALAITEEGRVYDVILVDGGKLGGEIVSWIVEILEPRGLAQRGTIEIYPEDGAGSAALECPAYGEDFAAPLRGLYRNA